LTEPEKLGAQALRALHSADNDLWLSPISIWEYLVLADKGRVQQHMDAAEWVSRALSELAVNEASLTREVALATSKVRLSHSDPADRFLVATAQVYELTLVTADAKLIANKQVRVLPNR
jgi:PIN domain nuclease of toxin-antitoxin system